jgi:predicted GNAT family acetyltransferase
VEYELSDGALVITHTIVPPPLEGQGIASQLVAFTYDYARAQQLQPAATCSYAVAWLKRHPELA